MSRSEAQHRLLVKKATRLVEQPEVQHVHVETRGPVTRLTTYRTGQEIPDRRPEEYLVPTRPPEYAKTRQDPRPEPGRKNAGPEPTNNTTGTGQL